MDEHRRGEVYRAIVKYVFREKGLRFKKDLTARDIGREVKEFNAAIQLYPPLTVVEMTDLYLEFMRELTTEHFASVEKHLDEAIKAEGSTKKPSIPGAAFAESETD
mgnify:CR=1 FL=1